MRSFMAAATFLIGFSVSTIAHAQSSAEIERATRHLRFVLDSAKSTGGSYKPNWKTRPSMDGYYAIDVNSIEPTNNGGAEGVVYIDVIDGEPFNPNKLRYFSYDCAGHYRVNFSPPLSFGGGISGAYQVGNIACSVASCLRHAFALGETGGKILATCLR
jgi:hypothetical protein